MIFIKIFSVSGWLEPNHAFFFTNQPVVKNLEDVYYHFLYKDEKATRAVIGRGP